MRRIVNGLLYDTETATEIAPEILTSEFAPSGRVHWSFQTLFETEKGAYFLRHYWADDGTFWRPERVREKRGRIYPRDEASALEWCEAEVIDPDTVRAHFPIEEA